jgi:hypothetical protein
VASARGDHEAAACILGQLERTKAALGTGFQAAWDGGYCVDSEQAITAALAYST